MAAALEALESLFEAGRLGQAQAGGNPAGGDLRRLRGIVDQYEALFVGLDARVEQLDEAGAGPDEPATTARLAVLLVLHCEVEFAGRTDEPVEVVRLRPDQIVASAKRLYDDALAIYQHIDRRGQRAAERGGLRPARAELRGLLEAYRAMAINTGRGEDPGLDGWYQAARQLIGAEPFDLDAATDAVRRYQRATHEMDT